MTKVVYAVRVDDAAEMAARLMVEQDIHRAVVANHDGSIAGIVSSLDVLRALVRREGPGTEASRDLRMEYVDLREMP